MSTTFAIKINNELVTVAFRHNGGRMVINNKLLTLLKDNRRVYAIDNTQQGVFTVKDIKREAEIK